MLKLMRMGADVGSPTKNRRALIYLVPHAPRWNPVPDALRHLA